MEILYKADEAIVVVGEERDRSTTVDTEFAKAMNRDGLEARQALIPPTVSPQLDTSKLPVVSLTSSKFLKEIFGDNSHQNAKLQVSHLTYQRLCAVIVNSHEDFGTNLQENGARWIISESKSRRSVRSGSRYRTRAEAVDKIQELLRISRGREVNTHMVCALHLVDH